MSMVQMCEVLVSSYGVRIHAMQIVLVIVFSFGSFDGDTSVSIKVPMFNFVMYRMKLY